MAAVALPAKASILIVDDEFFVLWGLQDLLEQMGFQSIVTASSTREGLDIMGRKKVEFAFLDVNLGPEKSFDLARELGAAGIPFVYVTGYGPSVVEGEFDDVAVLSKPITFATLAETVMVTG